jgi:hypothetical protein
MKDMNQTLAEVFNHIAISHPEFSMVAIESRRANISSILQQHFDGVIRYGPFKGFKFSESSWWGASDRASMLLGIYEQEVLSSLQKIPKNYRYFIDIGAADGYYGAGVIVGKLFEKSWCYEISEQGQKTIQANAKINNVSDHVVVRGKASGDFYLEFSADDAAQSVLFVDIEGGEFELFNDELFDRFKKSVIFIELHDWLFPDGSERLDRLRTEAEKYFQITSLTTKGRDLSVFQELQQMSDSDRWLICSEGRGRLMTWWRLDPLGPR